MKTQRSFEIPMQWRLPLVVGFVAAIFIIDLLTPRGIADGALYLLPLWYSRKLTWRHSIVAAAAAATGLAILGFFGSPDGVDILASLANRVLVMIVIWGTAAGLLLNRAHTERLSQALIGLQDQTGLTQESEKRFRATFEQAAVGMAHLAPDGRWLRVNQKLCDIVGYSREELLARSFHDITHPDDLGGDLSQVGRLLAGEITQYSMEKRYFHKNGGIVWIYLTATLVRTASGEPDYFISVIEDCTARKLAEQRLELLSRAVEQSVHVVVVTDAAGKVEYCNQQFTQVTGYTRAEVLGRKMNFVQSGETPPEVYASLWETILSGREWRGILRNKRKNGELYWDSLSISPVLDEKGVISHFIGIQEDITERRMLEEQVHQSQKMEVVGQLAGGIAHDFNNLLTVVLGNLQLVESSLKDMPEESELVQDAEKAAWRGAELSQRLLAFSRRQNLVPEAIDASELVRGMGSLLKRTLGGDIDLRVELGSALAAVVVDPGQLENAILNLALNARDAMPGGGTLSVHTFATSVDEDDAARRPSVAAGDFIVIEVSDTGTGMPPEVIERVFEPFFTTKEIGKGSGLGLSMVYGFLRQSGGHARIYSEVGIGTSVKLYFPAKPSHTATSRLRLPLPQDALLGGSERILVVEDDLQVKATICSMLKELGYTVLEANSGAGGLEVLRREGRDIDLLLSDVVMPGGMNGYQLIEQARGLVPALKAVLVSGFAANHANNGNSSPAKVEFLNKPFRKSDLARLLRKVLDS